MKRVLLFLSLFILVFLSITKANAQSPSLEWIDPVKKVPEGFDYMLYPTPSRGPKTEASYLLLLPPTYSITTNMRYPVIYWLHDEKGNQRDGIWMAIKLDSAMKSGLMPEAILVFVQALPSVGYIDSKDGKKPVEKLITKDLIKHIDASYRTINNRNGRGIEGMGMGGEGALQLGFRYPELFGAVSALAPSLLEMKDATDEVKEQYGSDDAYFAANTASTHVKNNAQKIRNQTKIRLLVGSQDRYLPQVTNFHNNLNEAKITHQFEVINGAKHMYFQLLAMATFNPYSFWKEAFKK